jgi:AcrR family transcriptional regulator
MIKHMNVNMDTGLDAHPGLRERKKQKTRDTIIRVALDLFEERGYEQTTIADIAEAAEISPRTIFAYFPSKEDIVFYDFADVLARLTQALRERPPGVTALDALRDFIAGSIASDADQLRRRCIIRDDEALQRSKRARFGPLEELMVDAIVEDLDAEPGDIRPQIVAAAISAAFNAIHDPNVPRDSMSPELAMKTIEDVMAFLRGGLEALRRP